MHVSTQTRLGLSASPGGISRLEIDAVQQQLPLRIAPSSPCTQSGYPKVGAFSEGMRLLLDILPVLLAAVQLHTHACLRYKCSEHCSCSGVMQSAMQAGPTP